MINALNDYREAFIKYNNICKVKIKEKTDEKLGLKSFSIDSKNKKIFVNIVKDNADYYLVESILQN